jgi:hypothetical protein
MDNLTKLKLFRLKDSYEYESYPDGSRATICTLSNEEGTVAAKGLAFCAPKDQFNRRWGRTLALARASMALYHRETMLPVSTSRPLGSHSIHDALYAHAGQFKAYCFN